MYSPQRIEEGLLAHAPAAPGPIVLSVRPEWAPWLHGRAQPAPAAALLADAMHGPLFARRYIEGESGTGKMLAAQTLHDIGPASVGPFLPCPAVQFFPHGPSLGSLGRPTGAASPQLASLAKETSANR